MTAHWGAAGLLITDMPDHVPVPGRISVVIPAHNAGETIARTLRSLATDAGDLREIILVNDRSSDDTVAHAKAAAEAFGLPLSVIDAEAGCAGVARNIGLAAATAPFVHFLDADDEMVSGGLTRLLAALDGNPAAGLAVGTAIRRTNGMADLHKVPRGYGNDRLENVRRYLRNDLWPMAMGSVLARRETIADLRFPQAAALDEDTVFWAAAIRRTDVVAVETPTLVYHHDEPRMRARFIGDPAPTFARISAALDTLVAHGVPLAFIDRRKAWVALRIARQLIMFGRYRDAVQFVDRAAADPDFARSWKVIQYRLRIGLGKAGLLRADNREAPPRQQRTGEARRFLIVTHDPVWPPVSGYDIRNWLIARSLSRHGDVVLASVRAPAGTQTDIPAITLASIAPDGSAAGARRLRRFRSAIEPRLTVGSLTALNRLVSSRKFDMTVFAGVGLGGLMQAERTNLGAVALDMHNVESDLLRQRHKRLGLPGRLAGLIQVMRAKRVERRAIEAADLVLSCSSQDRDRAIALHHPRAPVLIVPNGSLSRADTIRERKEAGSPTTILYAGHLGYWPNVEAAQRLTMRILPLVRQKVPEARLVLAGRSPKPRVKALGDLAGVTIVADPPDMGAMLRAATLTVVPLESGGGTRIKVLEAMVEGVPVVATRLAVEGLDLAEGLDYLAAETDEDLAGAAASLLQDAERAQAMSERARVRAISGFGDMAIDDAIDRALRAADMRSA